MRWSRMSGPPACSFCFYASFLIKIRRNRTDCSMDPGHPPLNRDCLIFIFTFLNDQDLLSASVVCKDWLEAAHTPWLWRRMCLQRWTFCNLAVLGSEDVQQAWRRYYLRRCHLEMRMTKGRSGGDYTCKSLRGHTGRVTGLVYLQANSAQLPDLCGSRSIVCSASADGTARAWNVQKGEQLWCTPVQSPLTTIKCDGELGLVITADSTGLIKSWQAETGQEVASFPTGSSRCTLLPYHINDSWYLSVGTGVGHVCTLAGSTLTRQSSVVVCDTFGVNVILLSPDKKWIAAGTRDNADFSPKVMYTESLTFPVEAEEPLCQNVPVTGCQAAVFIPTQPARLAIIHHNDAPNNRALTVFDVSIKKTKYKSEVQVQQVESFPLPIKRWSPDLFLEAKDSNTFVVAAEQELLVYSLKGELLASFRDHTKPISSLCMDSFRVVTASQDLSLRVLTWHNDREGGLTLMGRYHLLGGSQTMSRGFTHVVSDYSSVVASVESRDGKDVLKAYSFTS